MQVLPKSWAVNGTDHDFVKMHLSIKDLDKAHIAIIQIPQEILHSQCK